MNRSTIIAAFFALVFFGGQNALAQSGYNLLQKGLVQERVKGDLDEAIKVYERIIVKFPNNRPIVAKALLHIGLCYEKMGKQEAQKAYRHLIKEYTDQPEPVQIARERLQQLDAGASGAKANGPTYRLAFDSKIAGMPVKEGYGRRFLDFSPSGDRIVFVSQDNKLYIADETGSVIRPLLEGFAPWEQFAWPRWSPDGRQIAYMARREVTLDSGEKDSMFALFVLSPDGGTPRQIIPERESGFDWLRWTSDGKHLTYLDRGGVYTLALDGSQVRSIPRKDLPGRYRGRFGDAGYSPNGRWLAYCAFMKDPSEEYTTDVWIVPAAGGQAQALRHSPGDRKYPTWAPDGRTLYFVCGTADTGNIWKVAIDPETGLQREEPQQVTFFNDAEIVFPKVLRDGDQIAFEMERSSTSIHVANGSPPYESRALARCIAVSPEVSPDGQTIYYVADGIFAVPREGGTPRRLTKTHPTPCHYSAGFHLSGDGLTLAYTAKLDEGSGLFTLPVSGGAPQLLVKITELGAVPQWSPDGSQLAYADGHDIYVIGATGGQPSRIAHIENSGRRESGWDNWTVRWSPDGKFIAALGYTAKPETRNGVFVVPAAGGELRQLTPDGPDLLEVLEWHPDSQRISYNVDRHSSETRQAYLDGRPPTLLVDHPNGWDYIGAWAPDGRRFFFQCDLDDGKGYGIYIYDEASGGITLFSDIGGTQVAPRWSRDGKTAAWWVTRKTERQAWVMENFLPEPKAGE